jgi:hypothetical protein
VGCIQVGVVTTAYAPDAPSYNAYELEAMQVDLSAVTGGGADDMDEAESIYAGARAAAGGQRSSSAAASSAPTKSLLEQYKEQTSARQQPGTNKRCVRLTCATTP